MDKVECLGFWGFGFVVRFGLRDTHDIYTGEDMGRAIPSLMIDMVNLYVGRYCTLTGSEKRYITPSKSL